jgi:L-lactate utilization protein LutB
MKTSQQIIDEQQDQIHHLQETLQNAHAFISAQRAAIVDLLKMLPELRELIARQRPAHALSLIDAKIRMMNETEH